MSDLAVLVFGIIRDRLPREFTAEQFAASIDDFELIPVTHAGQTVGAVMRRGTELHVAIQPAARRRWMNKSVLALIQQTIETHGKATTKVMAGHNSGHLFASRLGFKPIGMDGEMVIYELRKMR